MLDANASDLTIVYAHVRDKAFIVRCESVSLRRGSVQNLLPSPGVRFDVASCDLYRRHGDHTSIGSTVINDSISVIC